MALTNAERQRRFKARMPKLTPIQRYLAELMDVTHKTDKTRCLEYTPGQLEMAQTVQEHIIQAKAIAKALNSEKMAELIANGHDAGALEGYTTIRLSKF